MKLVYPDINHVFDTTQGRVPTLIIENQPLLYRLLCDIRQQLEGGSGLCAVSENGSLLPMDKHVELLTSFIPFEINKRVLLAKASAAVERTVMEGELYGEAAELLRELEALLLKASLSFSGDLHFSAVSLRSLIKASEPQFREEYSSLAEKVIDYMELVTEFERKKLFVIYGLRGLISDRDAELFLDTVLKKEYNVIMVESSERERLSLESRYIVDASLCEIC